MKTAFSTPAKTILKTMMLTLGEFDFDDLFYNTGDDNNDQVNGTDYYLEDGSDSYTLPAELLYPAASYLLWIVFVLMMPIVLTNLLVCTV